MFENIWLTLVELNGHNSEHMCEAMPVVGHIIAGRDDRWARSKVQAAPNSSTKLSHLPRPTTALTRNGRVAMYGSGCVSLTQSTIPLECEPTSMPSSLARYAQVSTQARSPEPMSAVAVTVSSTSSIEPVVALADRTSRVASPTARAAISTPSDPSSSTPKMILASAGSAATRRPRRAARRYRSPTPSRSPRPGRPRRSRATMSVARQPSGRPPCWPAARWVVTTGSSRAGAGWMGRRAQPSTLPPQPSSTRRRHRQVPHLLTPQRNKPPAEITTYPTRDSSIPLQPRHFVTQPAPPGWGQANLTGRDARSANLDHRGGLLRGHRRGAGRHHHRPERGRAVAGGGGRASWSAPAADVYLSQPGPQRVGFQPHALPAPAQPPPVRSMQVGTAGAGSVYGVTGGTHTTFNSEAAGQSRTSFTASLAFSPACFTFADA